MSSHRAVKIVLLLGTWSLFLLSACPGPSQDASVLRVKVLDPESNKPKPDVAVVVNDPRGAVTQIVRTDEQGMAAVSVPPGGGMVSTFQTDGSTFAYVDTIVDPPAGMMIPFASYSSLPAENLPTTLQVTLKGLPAGTAAVIYAGSCNSSGSIPANQATLRLEPCGAALIDLLLVAQNSQGDSLGWAALLALPAAPGQTLMKNVSVDRLDFAQTTLEITGVPPGDFAQLRLEPAGALRTRLWHAPLAFVSAGDSINGQYQAKLSLPRGLSQDGFVTTVGYSFRQPDDWRYSFFGSVNRSQEVKELPSQTSFAAAAIPQVRVTKPDLSDALHPRVSWEGGNYGDAVVAYTLYQVESGPDVLWEVHAAPDRPHSLRLPDFPTELVRYTPRHEGWVSLWQINYEHDDAVQSFAQHVTDRLVNRPRSMTVTSGLINFDAPTPETWSARSTGQSASLAAVLTNTNEAGGSETWLVGGAGLVLKQTGELWNKVPVPVTEDLRAISAGSDGSVLAVGGHGTVLEWNGSLWTAASSGTTAELYGAFGFSGDFFVVGTGGTILEKLPGNSTLVPRTSGTTQTLYGVWGNLYESMWAVGAAGTILKWNGSSFSVEQSPTSGDIDAIWGSSSSDIWAPTRQGEILHFDGVTWSVAYKSQQELFGISGSDSLNVWAVGAAGTILRWDGKSWKQEPSGTKTDLLGVWANGDRTVWAVGKDGAAYLGTRL